MTIECFIMTYVYGLYAFIFPFIPNDIEIYGLLNAKENASLLTLYNYINIFRENEMESRLRCSGREI